MYTVLLSAPYLLPVVERFRPLFEDYRLALIVPQVHERLSVSSMPPSAGMIVTPSGCCKHVPPA